MEVFFDRVRRSFGPLNQKQVDGFNAILAASVSVPTRHRAYMLATAWHEVDKTMQPIEEYGKGKGKDYGRRDPVTGHAYYGRGLVQLTWKANYEKATARLKALGLIQPNFNLVLDPSIALRLDVAVHVLVIGMTEGWFTQKKLADFQTYKGMRYVVNGQDDAALIAGYAEKFEDALLAQALADATHTPASPTPAPPPKQPDDPGIDPMPPQKTSSAALAKLVGALLVAAIGGLIAFVTGLIGGN